MKDERPDLELDLPEAELPEAELPDLELPDAALPDLELAATPAPKAPPKAPPRATGPWRDGALRQRWALSQTGESPVHPLALLGPEAREDFAAFRAQREACRSNLRNLVELGGDEALAASAILRAPAFLAMLSYDEAQWSAARTARATPGGGLRLELFAGVTLERADELPALAIASEARWSECTTKLRDLALIVRHLQGQEAGVLRAALDEAERKVPADTPALRLQALLWALGPPVLRLPFPWSPRTCASPADLVGLADADAALLLPALEDGRLGLWLEHHAEGRPLARAAMDREVDPLLRAWSLLWALGERRLRVGMRDVNGAAPLREVLQTAVDTHEAFDALLARRVIPVWSRVLGDPSLADAAARAANAPSPALRRQVFCWALGDPALRPGVVDLESLVELARQDPDEAQRLAEGGELSAWALARGLTKRPLERGPGSGRRRLHEALWALGSQALLVKELRFDDLPALLARLDGPLLLQLESAEANGTLGRWLELHGVSALAPVEEPVALALRRRLWAAGWAPFHHPDVGLLADPTEVGALADSRPGALTNLVGTGWLWVWLEQVHRALVAPSRAAAAQPDPEESLARALGLSSAVGRVEPEELNFGAVPEGGETERVLRVHHAGTRGRLRVSAQLSDPYARLSPAHDRGTRVLEPGKATEIVVSLALPRGRAVRGEAALLLQLDGEQQVIPVTYRSRFDLGGPLRWVVGGSLVGALAMAGWQALVLAAGGEAILAADGGILTDVNRVVIHGPPSQLDRLALVVTALGLGGTLLLAAFARWRNR